jgi:arylformamidase
MKKIDISTGLSKNTVTYPGDPMVSITQERTLLKDGVRLSKISMGSHSGTHVDAPSHFLKDGKNIDEVGLKPLIGKAIVCDLTSAGKTITSSDLKGRKIRRGDILLLKTRNSRLLKMGRFAKDYASLSLDAAEYLVKRGVKTVGIDYLSIEDFGGKGLVHKKLLSAGIPIIEGLNLDKAKPGRYTLFCLPLNVIGCEAAPARCILMGR